MAERMEIGKQRSGRQRQTACGERGDVNDFSSRKLTCVNVVRMGVPARRATCPNEADWGPKQQAGCAQACCSDYRESTAARREMTLAGPEGDTVAEGQRPCLTRKRSEAGAGGSQTLENVKEGIQ